MKWWLFLLGIVVGVAGFLIGEMMGWIILGVGVLFLILGLFLGKKKQPAGQSFGSSTMMMGGNPAQTQVMQRI